MKKIMLVGLVLAVGMLGTLRSAYCASDAPGTQPGKFSIGVVQEYIFDRDMGSYDCSLVNGNLTETGTIKYKVQDMGMTMLKVGYQISNNLNIYTKLGVTNDGGKFSQKGSGTFTDPGATPDSGTCTITSEMEGDSAFVGGVGLKLTLPLKNNWIIGVDAQYLAHENDYSGTRSVRFFDNGVLIPGTTMDGACAGSATISEWHVAPFVAKNFGNFVPYIGVKYSDMQIDMGEGSDTLNAENNVGAFVGADFKVGKTFSLNLEGRFFDETAMSLAAMFTF